MENNSFKNMPQAPTLPNLPKYFPDLQGENCGRTPYAGWWQNKVLPWIQNQDPIQLAGMFFFGALTLIAGWYQNELMPWIQNQDQIQLAGMFFFGALTLIAGWHLNELWPWIQNQNPIQLVGMFLFGAITLIAGLYITIIIVFLFLLICIEEFISSLSNLNLGSMQFEPESGDM